MKVVFFTGAGISAESGVKTFRDNGGLWNEYKVEDVASYNGWLRNKELVLEFYNKRHGELNTVDANDAHRLIAELQNTPGFEVDIVTQNVDDLHERAGSSGVIHLHGSLLEMKSSLDPSLVYPWELGKDIKLGDKCEKGSQLRPNIVWFGESLDMKKVGRAHMVAKDADVIIIVGTSMQVQPAASLPFDSRDNCYIYYVDPGELNFFVPKIRTVFFNHIKENATTGVKKVIDEIKTFSL
jgi:NAD-dependent deacetylase